MSRLDSLLSPRLWLAAAASVVLAVSSLFLFLHCVRERADAEHRVEVHAARIADLAGRQVDLAFHNLQRIADIAVEALEQTWAPTEAAGLEAMALLSGLANAVPGVVDIAVIDPRGSRVFQASRKIEESAARSAGDLAALRHHRDDRRATLGVFGPSLAGPGRLMLARRIETVTGAFAGVVALWFEIADLVRLAEIDDEAVVAILGADGEILDIGARIAPILALVPALPGGAAGDDAWSRTSDRTRGMDAVVLHRRLANGLRLAVAGDMAEALAGWRAATLRIAIWYALALLPFATTVCLLLREIRRREDAQRAVDAARRAELEATRGEARRLALVARHTGSAVIITDAAERIEWVNPAFTAITGHALESAQGRRCGELLQGPDSDPATRAAMRAALAAGERFRVEIVNYARDGRRYWAEIDCAPVRGPDGAIERYIAIVADVTVRKDQEARLAAALAGEREANATQRRFVSMASHEFRTPLAIIDGAAQRLDAGLPGADARVRARIERIRAAVVRMTEMIDRTLSSARLDAGRIGFEPAAMDLAQLLRDLVARQRELSPGFAIDLSLEPQTLPVDGDRRLLEQVVTNLLSNAVKYSGASRRVEIRARAAASDIEFAVSDHGIGIHADELDRLFTRYFRARTAMGIPGTGIGLNLVRELVAMHGGTIEVRSQLGRGSTFVVRLPARRPLAAVA